MNNLPEFTDMKVIGKIDCLCNIQFRVNAEIILTPKSVKITCQNCGRYFFYRRIPLVQKEESK